MKRHMVIDIDIDTDNNEWMSRSDLLKPRASYSHTDYDENGNLKGAAQVRIMSDVVKAKADLTSVLAHEVGHVLAKTLNLPAARAANANDSRSEIAIAKLLGLGAPQVVVEEEKEAWGIANKMGLPLDSKTVDFSMRSYRNGGLSVSRGSKVRP